MSDRVQFRRDTKARWSEINPVLMEGEVGLEIDTKNIKMGDGVHAWNELEYGVGYSNVTNALGHSENLAVSQNLVTLNLAKKADIEQMNNSLYNLEQKIGDRIVVEGDVVNLPDEEDLISVKESERDVIKLADRAYMPENFSGKGYKILRKNITPIYLAVTKIIISSVPTSDGTIVFTINGVKVSVDMVTTTMTSTDLVAQKIAEKLTETMTEYEVSKNASTITLNRKFAGSVTPSVFSASTTGIVCTVTDSTKQEIRNILTPTMMNQPNTIYVIRYDFDLNGQTIQVQDNCTLMFHGGKLKNGTIKGNNTQIEAVPSLIFNNITFSGRWRIYNYFPEWFISDFSDCTDGIQQAINFASINNGGKIVFQSRQYNVKSIHTGIKTNLIGSGIGATIIKQIEGTNKSLIDLPVSSAGILIDGMTLKGNNEAGCHGISKAEKSSGGENHEYIYSEVTSYDKQIAFRWSTFRNLAIYNFDKGIHLANFFLDAYIEKCSIGYCNIGIHFDCTDSSICDTYIFQNRESGLYLSGSNNKIINIKSIFNGRREGTDNEDAAFYVTGSRNALVSCESQDNFCSGFIVKGYENTFCACISNTDGYKYIDDNSYEHKPDYDANKCGFVCNWGKTNNIFSGCLVTTYLNECAISANLLAQDADFEGIDCIAGNETYLEFNEIPYNYIHHNNCALFNYTLSNDSKKLIATSWDGIDVALDKPINIDGITIAVVFKVGNDYNRNDGRLLKIGKGYEVVVTNIQEKDGYAYLVLKQVTADFKYNITAEIKKEKEIKAFFKLSHTGYSMSLETHTDKGLMYVNKNIDLEYKELCSSLTLLFYCPSISISKFVISKEGYRTADALQNVSLSRYYKNAIVAIDAEATLFDNYLKKGSTEKRPTLKSNNKGFVYFDTTLNKNITWNGFKWIDENGNPSDAKKQGTTKERPSNVQIGYIYKDTTLKKLIIWDGAAWVNLDGTTLS